MITTEQINTIRIALDHQWGPEQEAIIMCMEREILIGGGERGGGPCGRPGLSRVPERPCRCL